MSSLKWEKLGKGLLARSPFSTGRTFTTAPRRPFRGTEYLQPHDLDLGDSQRTVREAIAKICTKFPDDYWLDIDNSKKWPIEFTQAIAKDGWLGICMPAEYGGADLGLVEASIMMQTVSESGGGTERSRSISTQRTKRMNQVVPQPPAST